MKITTHKCIYCQDLDALVQETYGRPYKFQQQDDCRDRGAHYVTVPDPAPEDYEATEIPEVLNGDEQGVSFAAWLARDPKAPVDWGPGPQQDWHIDLFWARNFYPDLSMVLNDLHARGLIDAGDYVIVIDW